MNGTFHKANIFPHEHELTMKTKRISFGNMEVFFGGKIFCS